MACVEVRYAGVLQNVEVAELRRNAGSRTVLFHEHVEHPALDRAAAVAQEDRPGHGAADFQPGAQGLTFLAHQMMLTRVRSLQPVDVDALGVRVVVAQLQPTDFGGPQSQKKRNPTQGGRRWDATSLDELIDEFTIAAGGVDERILAILQALEEHVILPAPDSSSASRSRWLSSNIRGTSGAG